MATIIKEVFPLASLREIGDHYFPLNTIASINSAADACALYELIGGKEWAAKDRIQELEWEHQNDGAYRVILDRWEDALAKIQLGEYLTADNSFHCQATPGPEYHVRVWAGFQLVTEADQEGAIDLTQNAFGKAFNIVGLQYQNVRLFVTGVTDPTRLPKHALISSFLLRDKIRREWATGPNDGMAIPTYFYKELPASFLIYWQRRTPAALFVLVVLCGDGYFLVTPEMDSKARRFFEVASKLPLEIQMMLCHRVFDSSREIVKSVDFDKAFWALYSEME